MGRKFGPKQCSKCGKLKPRTEEYFIRRSPASTAYQPKCKECTVRRRGSGRDYRRLERLADQYRP